MALSIAMSMLPSQEASRQNFPAPRQFGEDWRFVMNRTPQLDFVEGADMFTCDNYFRNREPVVAHQNGIFNPTTGAEPLAGHINYKLNPADQEQTNAKMSGYQLQKVTRVRDNMSPAGVMRFPTYTYPVNTPPNFWVHHFNGSGVSK